MINIIDADNAAPVAQVTEAEVSGSADPVAIDSAPVEIPPVDPVVAIKADSSFLDWAIDSSIEFLNLADLEGAKTVEALRGTKEDVIRDKIQIANSVLVLAANYGSKNDNEDLVSACTLYAEKMKTIIKRLCL